MSARRKRYDADYYVDNILNNDKVILSRSITVIESVHPDDEKLAAEILNKILPYTGNSKRIGLTGSPGVGKSTFIEAFGKEILKNNHKLAILTIDPSSIRTKGSILGDKTRMNDLSKDNKVFIRPSPAGQSLGGVSAKTREVMLLCEAAGFNVIIIETVGVGQSETLVKGMVDFFLLLMLAGGGDELQGIKRGIMELADMILITKSDGENVEKAKRSRQDFENALAVLKNKSTEIPQVMTCSAVTNYNVPETWSQINENLEKVIQTGVFSENRKRQNLDWMHQIVQNKLKQSFYSAPAVLNDLNRIEEEILAGKIDASFAANKLLNQYWNSFDISTP